MSPYIRPGASGFLAAVILAPLNRVAGCPPEGRVLGLLLALWSMLRADVFASMLPLVIASGVIDYFFGRRVARRRADYQPDLARAGAYSKVGGILLLLLVRWFEHNLSLVLDSSGMIATALCTGLFVVDLESIDHHRRALGGRPIPGLRQIVTLVRALPQRLIEAAAVAAATPRRPAGRSAGSDSDARR